MDQGPNLLGLNVLGIVLECIGNEMADKEAVPFKARLGRLRGKEWPG
jgi:hypothetical protein